MSETTTEQPAGAGSSRRGFHPNGTPRRPHDPASSPVPGSHTLRQYERLPNQVTFFDYTIGKYVLANPHTGAAMVLEQPGGEFRMATSVYHQFGYVTSLGFRGVAERVGDDAMLAEYEAVLLWSQEAWDAVKRELAAKAVTPPVEAFLQALALARPCTTRDVRRAYRALVRKAHPDHGGTHEAFLALQRAYEQALRDASATKRP